MGTVSGHAWTAHRFGDPLEVLKYEARSWDSPPAGEVLVEVAAAGVGLPDLLMTRGSYPLVREAPISPGQEVCGWVIATSGDGRLRVGERICGPTAFHSGSGGFATHTYVPEDQAMVAPEPLSDAEAAGFYIGFLTAHTALVTRCSLEPGESVLVLGAAGGTGSASILLAKALGANVVAVASSEIKRRFCSELGADAVVAPKHDAIAAAVADHTAGRGFDVVVDPVGGDVAHAALKAVARYGRYATVGFASGSWVTPSAAHMAVRNYSVVGVLAAGFDQIENEQHTAELGRLVLAGQIHTPLGRVAPMAEVPEVIASLADSAPPGKQVIALEHAVHDAH
jgi:NADPH2:quinone reductase